MSHRAQPVGFNHSNIPWPEVREFYITIPEITQIIIFVVDLNGVQNSGSGQDGVSHYFLSLQLSTV